MDLKLLPIFLLIGFVIVPAYALTSNEVMQRYKDPIELQDAINNCQITYNDLPDEFHKYIFDNPKCQSGSSTPDKVVNKIISDNIISPIAYIFASLFFILALKKQHIFKKISKLFCFLEFLLFGLINSTLLGLDQNGKIGMSIIIISMFSGIAIAFYVRGKQADVYNKKNLEHFKSNKEPDGIFNTCGVMIKDKDGNILNPRQPELKHSPIHKILLALKIIRVKRNA